jgi:hypothetical protein
MNRNAMRWVVRIGAVLVLSPLIMRWVHVSETGVSLLSAVPDSFWLRYHELVGAERLEGEAVHDVNDALIAMVTLALSAGCVALIECAVRHLRRSAASEQRGSH